MLLRGAAGSTLYPYCERSSGSNAEGMPDAIRFWREGGERGGEVDTSFVDRDLVTGLPTGMVYSLLTSVGNGVVET